MKPETIKSKNHYKIVHTEQTNTCSKTTIKTLDQGGK